MNRPPTIASALTGRREVTLAAVPDGMTGTVLADLARASRTWPVTFIARDGRRSTDRRSC
jgi:hypothetical protein